MAFKDLHRALADLVHPSSRSWPIPGAQQKVSAYWSFRVRGWTILGLPLFRCAKRKWVRRPLGWVSPDR